MPLPMNHEDLSDRLRILEGVQSDLEDTGDPALADAAEKIEEACEILRDVGGES